MTDLKDISCSCARKARLRAASNRMTATPAAVKTTDQIKADDRRMLGDAIIEACHWADVLNKKITAAMDAGDTVDLFMQPRMYSNKWMGSTVTFTARVFTVSHRMTDAGLDAWAAACRLSDLCFLVGLHGGAFECVVRNMQVVKQ
jgi:hypothetical protein